ncbi:MAG: SNF2-related protein [Myxococcaceae bacterium]
MSSVANKLEPQPLTPFHQRLFAEELTLKSGDAKARAARAISEARVDLNPHQVEAAAFAIESLQRGGCLLADEVGLGKTIEAGIVLAQLFAEGKTRLLVLAPATLRAQWQAELKEKFDLEAVVIDGRTKAANPFDQAQVVISSIPFAALRPEALGAIPWDLVVIDEAHRLRNSHRPGNKTGKALKQSLRDRPKLLLTATPLQNELGELYGLLSLLDEQILGPYEAFDKHFGAGPDGIEEQSQVDLKDRLAPVVQRTLRRQVREYVRFTNRRSVVEDFAPSADEETLYEDVSEWLRTSEVLALEPGRKTLLTLVYRKLLASSTFAIGPTLAKVAEGLRKQLEGAKLSQQADWLIPREADAFSEEAEEWADDPKGQGELRKLMGELKLLDNLVARANKIGTNAKGEALKRALDRVFTVARAHQWPEKAVIFTESKRTQEYLIQLLSAHGYAGKVLGLSGDAGSPEERRALVEEFRNSAQLLISTEAGAEGLNLQFCNLVVNFDLPWNPQRIEQRIGRCHRYGQQRDVLVLNFLNTRNAADARLYELLEKKLELFDGVFGASDEILGALGNGVDFEKRILDIYQSCRKPQEIDAAFDALRSSLEDAIGQRMSEAKAMLLERFDGDVRRRLRLAGESAKAEVQKRKARQGALTEAPAKVKQRQLDAVSYLEVDAAGVPSLSGKEGWWFAYRFELSGLKPEERLVNVVLLRDGDKFKLLPIDDGAALMKADAREASGRRAPPVSIALEQEKAVEAAKEQLVKAIERRTVTDLDEAKERADRFAEDCLMSPRESVEDARKEWEEARKAMHGVEDPAERVKARANLERKEREYRKRISSLRVEEERRYQEKDGAMAKLSQRAKVSAGRTLIGSAYFWVA